MSAENKPEIPPPCFDKVLTVEQLAECKGQDGKTVYVGIYVKQHDCVCLFDVFPRFDLYGTSIPSPRPLHR